MGVVSVGFFSFVGCCCWPVDKGKNEKIVALLKKKWEVALSPLKKWEVVFFFGFAADRL